MAGSVNPSARVVVMGSYVGTQVRNRIGGAWEAPCRSVHDVNWFPGAYVR